MTRNFTINKAAITGEATFTLAEPANGEELNGAVSYIVLLHLWQKICIPPLDTGPSSAILEIWGIVYASAFEFTY